MPELPDVTVYVEALQKRLTGERLVRATVVSPNLLRTVEPPLDALYDRPVTGVRRIGKRIAVAFDAVFFLVIHLMIAGRFRWKDVAAKAPGKVGLAAFEFTSGTLIMTEAGTKKRASVHVLNGERALEAMDPGGLEPLGSKRSAFKEALTRERHTLKRALTSPKLISGIGNAYSDEILHRARLSPLRQTHQLDDDAIERLHVATQDVLTEWTERLRAQTGNGFPEKVTAFREGMAVHGRYREPCPVCGAPVQRIRYADNETNYCARCQTNGRVLADRSLSRLLRSDWPRSLDDWER